MAIALAMRPSLLRPEVPLRTRGAQADTTLAGRRAVAEQLATRFVGRRLGVMGPSELLFLGHVRNALPFGYWNAATWSFYRARPNEESRDTLLRLIRESRLDGVIYPREVLGDDPRLAAEFAATDFVWPRGDYRVTGLAPRR